MEKGPSTYAEYWTSSYNEVDHYKHAKEFGFDKITYYSEAAMKFAKSEEAGLKEFKRSDGSTCKYNSETKEFIAISKEGKIIKLYFRKSKQRDCKSNERLFALRCYNRGKGLYRSN